MRFIANLVFLAALIGGILFGAFNWQYLQFYTPLRFVFGTVLLPLNLILFLAYLGLVFLQWLLTQAAWAARHRKLVRAENEITRLKARLYDLTEGSWVDELREAIKETRKELREDIRWLASQPQPKAPIQLAESQLPPLLKQGEK
ncbi:MAG: hypothetical protein ACOYZ7_02205 [Chloroflexota bacterium]